MGRLIELLFLLIARIVRLQPGLSLPHLGTDAFPALGQDLGHIGAAVTHALGGIVVAVIQALGAEGAAGGDAVIIGEGGLYMGQQRVALGIPLAGISLDSFLILLGNDKDIVGPLIHGPVVELIDDPVNAVLGIDAALTGGGGDITGDKLVVVHKNVALMQHIAENVGPFQLQGLVFIFLKSLGDDLTALGIHAVALIAHPCVQAVDPGEGRLFIRQAGYAHAPFAVVGLDSQRFYVPLRVFKDSCHSFAPFLFR